MAFPWWRGRRGKRPGGGRPARRPELEALEDRCVPSATLVKDINPGPGGAFNYAYKFTAVGGTVFFPASNGANGWELWKSDGTPDGTVMVKDIRAGSGTSGPDRLTNVNGTLFFTADDGTHGYELWKSDGTPEGTVLVKDIFPGAGSSVDTHDRAYFTGVGDTLYFMAKSANWNWELWKSDGTEAGTTVVKEIGPGNNGSSPKHMTNVDGTLFFMAYGAPGRWDLWKTDGSEDGTVMLKTSVTWAHEYAPAAMNGNLFFTAPAAGGALALWKSDGTEAGTTVVKDVAPFSVAGNPVGMTVVDGTLYFVGSASGSGAELWKSDGTPDGTVLVKDINPGSASSAPKELTDVNGTLFFVATSPGKGDELWKSDGTADGTVLVKDIYPGATGSSSKGLVNVGGTLYFAASWPGSWLELWKSDGTPDGTVLVKDFLPNGGGLYSSYESLTAADGKLFLAAIDGTHGAELWAVLPPAPTVDLNWTSGGITVPGTVVAGSSFTVSRTYTVGGAAASAFTIGYYGSADDVFGNADDFLLGTEAVSGAGLAVGTHAGSSPAFTISAAGAYFVFARLDNNNQVSESDETNNVAQAPQPVEVTTPPAPTADLNWSGGGVLVATPVQAGAAFQVSRTYAVAGAEVAAFVIGYYASVDDVFGNDDDFLLGTEAVSDPGGRSVGSHPGASPAFVLSQPGTYYVFARLDDGGQVAESDETNNVALAPELVEVLP